MSVQIGFVAGALVSAALNIADRFRAEHVIAASALIGAGFNAAIALFEPAFSEVLVLRFLTGVMLAGTYPPGMKVVASWFKRERGLLNAVPLFGGAAGRPAMAEPAPPTASKVSYYSYKPSPCGGFFHGSTCRTG